MLDLGGGVFHLQMLCITSCGYFYLNVIQNNFLIQLKQLNSLSRRSENKQNTSYTDPLQEKPGGVAYRNVGGNIVHMFVYL